MVPSSRGRRARAEQHQVDEALTSPQRRGRDVGGRLEEGADDEENGEEGGNSRRVTGKGEERGRRGARVETFSSLLGCLLFQLCQAAALTPSNLFLSFLIGMFLMAFTAALIWTNGSGDEGESAGKKPRRGELGFPNLQEGRTAQLLSPERDFRSQLEARRKQNQELLAGKDLQYYFCFSVCV